MKAKKAIQQKMYHENSWGDGKQRLEELYVHFWQVRRKRKGFGTVARLTIVLNGQLEPIERMTIFSNE